MIKSCYIHIPFCNKICSYCDFCKLFYNEEIAYKYLDSLEKEIMSIYKGDILDTIYIGGGTPSSLSIEQLEELFQILKRLKTNKNIEYTIECNFDSVNKEKLLLFKKYGINRLSFGVESIDKNNLELLQRNEDQEKIKNIMNLCRRLGFNNINIDLMYAIPKEDINVLEKDLEFVLKLNPEHISTYSLIIEEHTKLYLNKTKPISEDLDFLMYKKICTTLNKNSYQHYEISNFAKKGYKSLHNLTYWKNLEYYGFGLGASSYIENKRITNTRSLTKYLNNNYQLSIEKLTKKDKIIYEIILGLRLLEGISKKEFYNKYKLNLDSVFNIEKFINSNLVNEKKEFVYIDEDKMYLNNEILVRIMEEIE